MSEKENNQHLCGLFTQACYVPLNSCTDLARARQEVRCFSNKHMSCKLPCFSCTLQTHTTLLYNENSFQEVPCISIQKGLALQGLEYGWWRYKKVWQLLFTAVAALQQGWNSELTARFHSPVKGMQVKQILFEEPVYLYYCTAENGTVSSITKSAMSAVTMTFHSVTCSTPSGGSPAFRL